MGHLSLLMWIKLHHNQNTFTGVENSNFTTVEQKLRFEFFWKGKNFKKPQLSELMTYIFVVIALTHCAMQ